MMLRSAVSILMMLLSSNSKSAVSPIFSTFAERTVTGTVKVCANEVPALSVTGTLYMPPVKL